MPKRKLQLKKFYVICDRIKRSAFQSKTPSP